MRPPGAAVDLAALRRFGFLTLPNYSLIACTNAIEACRMANRLAGVAAYEWQTVTLDGEPTPSSSGLALHPTARLDTAAPFDVLFVCGGVDVRHAKPPNLGAALRRAARAGTALGSLCTGAFALAEAALLTGYRCAIHWENLAAIREEFPEIEFVEDMFAIDRDRLTCSGGVAPLDMLLALVAARFGRALAAKVSAQFIVERIRTGSERQHLTAESRALPHPALARAVRLIEANLELPSLPAVAEHARISPRQLERLFQRYLGTTPAAFAASTRLERAREMLRQTNMRVTEVGLACGFASASHFSSAYRGRFGQSPRAERTP